MATIPDSSTTYAELIACYKDNVLYDINDSVDECSALIAACRILLVHPKISSAEGEGSMEMSVEQLEAILEKAMKWRNLRTAGTIRTTHVAISSGRYGRNPYDV